MTSYIDYNYYHNTFGGTLVPQDEFNKYSTLASNEVRTRIFNRDITDYEDLVKTTTCLVVELIYNQEQLKNKSIEVLLGNEAIITSEKVGDYSRNISNLSVKELKEITSNKEIEQEITDLIYKYLLITGLCYTGCNVY